MLSALMSAIFGGWLPEWIHALASGIMRIIAINAMRDAIG
jgi:hypothetical protein